MPNEFPHSRNNLREITTRNEIARHIVTGFAASLPNLAAFWNDLIAALSDTEGLTTEIAALRLDRANLLAAMRATIAAHAEGEPDPLSYLRDELEARHAAIQRTREPS